MNGMVRANATPAAAGPRPAGPEPSAAPTVAAAARPAHLAYIRDTIWTLNSPLLYGLLVDQRGWPVEAYRDWIATALIALTRRSRDRRPAGRDQLAGDGPRHQRDRR
jgi:hypothetical protein